MKYKVMCLKHKYETIVEEPRRYNVWDILSIWEYKFKIIEIISSIRRWNDKYPVLIWNKK